MGEIQEEQVGNLAGWLASLGLEQEQEPEPEQGQEQEPEQEHEQEPEQGQGQEQEPEQGQGQEQEPEQEPEREREQEQEQKWEVEDGVGYGVGGHCVGTSIHKPANGAWLECWQKRQTRYFNGFRNVFRNEGDLTLELTRALKDPRSGKCPCGGKNGEFHPLGTHTPNENIVGAHVMVKTKTPQQDELFPAIIPTCSSCNVLPNKFYISGGVLKYTLRLNRRDGSDLRRNRRDGPFYVLGKLFLSNPQCMQVTQNGEQCSFPAKEGKMYCGRFPKHGKNPDSNPDREAVGNFYWLAVFKVERKDTKTLVSGVTQQYEFVGYKDGEECSVKWRKVKPMQTRRQTYTYKSEPHVYDDEKEFIWRLLFGPECQADEQNYLCRFDKGDNQLRKYAFKEIEES